MRRLAVVLGAIVALVASLCSFRSFIGCLQHASPGGHWLPLALAIGLFLAGVTGLYLVVSDKF